MDHLQGTIIQKIARAARAYEEQRTTRGRNWVPVFMNEDTILLALHGFLTVEETALALDPAGATRLRTLQRQTFATDSAPLLRQINAITGMEVHYTSTEIDLTTASVVQIFTSDTVAENFLVAPKPSSGTPVHEMRPVERLAASAAPPKRPALGSREDRPISTERN